jgi:hypothetical protein
VLLLVVILLMSGFEDLDCAGNVAWRMSYGVKCSLQVDLGIWVVWGVTVGIVGCDCGYCGV